MELKVWVEGIQRIVCGVTETTTCQDVVFALAHATGKSGRFTLIERWRCNERLLAPNEQPLKILSKWGEYSSDVQFILQWNDSNNKNNSPIQPNQFSNNISTKLKTQNPPPVTNPTVAASNLLTPQNPISIDTTDKASKADFQIYKSISSPPNKSEVSPSSSSSDHLLSPKKQYHPPVHNVLNASNSSSPLSSNHNDILKREVPPYKEPPSPPVPPPYRDPPPPQQTQNLTNNNNYKQKKNYIKDINRQMEFNNDENNMYNSQYKELIQLVNYQREKLSLQQADLTKYDAEIVYWESKSREHQGRLDFIAQELVKVSNISRVNNDKIKALSYIEEENEIVRQQEKTLKSEITLLRSKLANCETELLQCKNKIRLLMDELQLEKRAQLRLGESQMQLERSLLTEVDRLQHQLELANQSTERNQATAEQLKRDVAILESAIVTKKKEVESLVNEMKEANLLSLSITSAEEIRHLLEGPIKAGSTRKIIGSPRQLENAVPTNKNPHGVWV